MGVLGALLVAAGALVRVAAGVVAMTASSRCFDCFQEFADDESRFVVLKKMRDLDETMPNGDRAIYESLTYDPVVVCVDCAGWYGDEAIAV